MQKRALETVNAEEPRSSSEALDCWSLCRHGAPANKRQRWVRYVEVASKCREAELVYGDIGRGFSRPKTLRSLERAKGVEVSHTLPRAREQVTNHVSEAHENHGNGGSTLATSVELAQPR